MNIWLQDDFLTEEEISSIKKEIDIMPWSFDGHSKNNSNLPTFWYKDITTTNTYLLLKKRLERGFNLKTNIDRAYVNGQAHSQSGYWHTDVDIYENNTYTLVYFFNEWPAEYGGHLLIRNKNEIISYLPQKNRAVIFHSNLEHMGLEPSCYCKTQRESIAVKFRLGN